MATPQDAQQFIANFNSTQGASSAALIVQLYMPPGFCGVSYSADATQCLIPEAFVRAWTALLVHVHVRIKPALHCLALLAAQYDNVNLPNVACPPPPPLPRPPPPP
eukprot:256679-Chlamydomonas_euryale.AAC.1